MEATSSRPGVRVSANAAASRGAIEPPSTLAFVTGAKRAHPRHCLTSWGCVAFIAPAGMRPQKEPLGREEPCPPLAGTPATAVKETPLRFRTGGSS